ncbi:MAG: putative Ig domain-containing protein, partial [Acidobacteriota bacterium]|nr:putative Ig domain-containing protein [Acidobacteriota bacterium]
MRWLLRRFLAGFLSVTGLLAMLACSSNGGSTPAVAPPSNLAYSLPQATYLIGVAITPNTPTSSGGAVASYAVAPGLPAGLVLNANTGVISGTPTVAATSASYTVTASNAGGSATAILNLSVRAPILDVYVAGRESNGTNNIAKIWKNGVATALTNGTAVAEVYGIAISGSDAYAVGYEYAGPIGVAKVWKNGSPTSLSNGTNFALAESLVVSGTDVHAVGYEHIGTTYVATYWKNGVATSITDGTHNAFGEGVAVSGTDVYVT